MRLKDAFGIQTIKEDPDERNLKYFGMSTSATSTE